MIENRQFLHHLFHPLKYSVNKSLELLRNQGGVACLLNNLNVYHRQGLPYDNINSQQQRQNKEAKRKLPSILSREPDNVIQNFILYLITLTLTIKILLYQEGIKVEMEFVTEVISFGLIYTNIYLKTKINFAELIEKRDPPPKLEQSKQMRVRRGGQCIQVPTEMVQPGDIVIFSMGQSIWIDGIVVFCQNLSINEENTISNRVCCSKQTIWSMQGSIESNLQSEKFGRVHKADRYSTNNQFDPFILAGSKVLTGEVDVLVCLIGHQTSIVQKGDLTKSQIAASSLIKIRQLITKVFKINSFLLLILAFCLTVIFMLKQTSFETMYIRLLGIYCSLLTYLKYTSELGILKSLTHFLVTHSKQNGYTIQNNQAFQRLTSSNLLIIEQETLDKKRSLRGNYMNKIRYLSELNKFINLKIVINCENSQSRENQEKQLYESRNFSLQNDHLPMLYDQDLVEQCILNLAQSQASFNNNNSSQFLSYNPNATAQSELDKLIKAVLIQSPSNKKFMDQTLPLIKQLRYRSIFIKNASGTYKQESQLPQQILSISSNCVSPSSPSQLQTKNDNSHINLKSGHSTEQLIYELFTKAFIYAQLHNAYTSVILSTLIQLLLLIVLASEMTILNMNLNMLLIIVNRLWFYEIYRYIVIQRMNGNVMPNSNTKYSRINYLGGIRINLLVLIYFVYLFTQIGESKHAQLQLFSVLIVNKVAKIQSIAYKHGINSGSINRLAKIVLWISVILVIKLLAIIANSDKQSYSDVMEQFWQEAVDIIVIPFIYWLENWFM